MANGIKIEANTTIEDIVKDYPELIRPLREYGIQCVACGEPIWGTVQDNAIAKGIGNLETILEELNRIITKNNRETLI
jgi:hypothetical protein